MSQEKIRDLINHIEAGDTAEIQQSFEAIIAERLGDAIDQRHKEISSSIFAPEINEEFDLTESKIEDTEELDEISKDALKAYAKKAVPDMQKSQKQADDAIRAGENAQDDDELETHYNTAKKARDRTEKRMVGITRAIRRVTKEETEELGEDQSAGFVPEKIPTKNKEQKKVSRLSNRLSTARKNMMKPGPVTVTKACEE